MRDKEVQQDYRFMPEPNLPPLHVYEDTASIPRGREPDSVVVVDKLRSKLPPLPQEIRKRMQEEHNIPWPIIVMIVGEEGLFEIFDELVRSRDARTVALFLCNHFIAVLRARKLDVPDSPLSAAVLGEILDLQKSGFVNMKTAVKVLNVVMDQPDYSPRQVVLDKDWTRIADPRVLARTCQEVFASETKAVEEYRNGKKQMKHHLFGKVVEKLNERADNEVLKTVIEEALSKLN